MLIHRCGRRRGAGLATASLALIWLLARCSLHRCASTSVPGWLYAALVFQGSGVCDLLVLIAAAR
jgi:hypothetical protein